MKNAIFSCLGLGDGLLALTLSHNLHIHGDETVTFHPSLTGLQEWLPHLPIRPFPPNLEEFDRFFIVYEKTPWMEKVLKECLGNYRDRTVVLNPIATPNTDYPYWEEGRFDGNFTFAENLYRFCRDVLKLPDAVKGNGISIPQGVSPRSHRNRVVIHPTSSRPGKNWSREKFLRLGELLKKKGYDPVFIVGPKERDEWPEALVFPTLSAMAAFVAESGYMIGNDSGIGHLASGLGLPTVTLCRNARTANFWRPDWAPGAVVLPSHWLPNIKGLRLRDQKWQLGISAGRVLRRFQELCVFCDERARSLGAGEKDVVGQS